MKRRTIAATDNAAVVNTGRARNNGRYNGNGRLWETPPEVFDPLHREFEFTLDVCATPMTAKVRRFFTEVDNGLLQDWGRNRCWMNPPYGREIPAWTSKAVKAARAGATVVGLLPVSSDLPWWHEDVVPHAAHIRWIRGRPRFLTGGPYRASAFQPSCIVVWLPGLIR